MASLYVDSHVLLMLGRLDVVTHRPYLTSNDMPRALGVMVPITSIMWTLASSSWRWPWEVDTKVSDI